MKYYLKNTILFFLRFFNANLCNRASILMYHSVAYNDAFFTVSPKNFEKQLVYIKKRGFNVIQVKDLIHRIKQQQDISNCVCLTFDDGYCDNYKIVYPLLIKYRFPATFFVLTGRIGKNIKLPNNILLDVMKEQQIKKISTNNLIEVMPHAHSHISLNEMKYKEAVDEINLSKKIIKNLTGKQKQVFCFPRGKFTYKILKYLKLEQWDGAVTVINGLVNLNSDIFMLPRNAVVSTTSMNEFKSFFSKSTDVYNKIKKYIV